jgi:hypothetical protein
MGSLKRVVLTVLLLSGVVFSAAPAFAYELDIDIRGLGDFDLAAFGLDVHYDSALLTFEEYTLTDQLGSFDFFEVDDWSLGDDGLGTVSLSVVSFLTDPMDPVFTSQSSSFTLATLSFSGDDSAICDFSLSNVVLSDFYGDSIPFDTCGPVINAVPVPAAAWLLASGLVGIIGLGRRSRK